MYKCGRSSQPPTSLHSLVEMGTRYTSQQGVYYFGPLPVYPWDFPPSIFSMFFPRNFLERHILGVYVGGGNQPMFIGGGGKYDKRSEKKRKMWKIMEERGKIKGKRISKCKLCTVPPVHIYKRRKNKDESGYWGVREVRDVVVEPM